MLNCFDFETESHLDESNCAEQSPFLIRMCWILFAGFSEKDAYSDRLHDSLKKNKRIGGVEQFGDSPAFSPATSKDSKLRFLMNNTKKLWISCPEFCCFKARA